MGRVGLEVHSFPSLPSHFSFVCSTLVLTFCVSLFSSLPCFFSHVLTRQILTIIQITDTHLNIWTDTKMMSFSLLSSWKERAPRVSRARLAKLRLPHPRPATLFTTTRHHPTHHAPTIPQSRLSRALGVNPLNSTLTNDEWPNGRSKISV